MFRTAKRGFRATRDSGLFAGTHTPNNFFERDKIGRQMASNHGSKLIGDQQTGRRLSQRPDFRKSANELTGI